jgi:hypothetical protein
MAEEHFLLVLAIGDLAELVGEAPLVTIARASLVACSISDEAPEVMFSLPNFSSSAMRPPIMIARREIMYL